MPECVRCGRAEDIERHHIIRTTNRGDNIMGFWSRLIEEAPENLIYLCHACHKFVHQVRIQKAWIELGTERRSAKQVTRWTHRLQVLRAFNTIQLVRERGTYKSYYDDPSCRAHHDW